MITIYGQLEHLGILTIERKLTILLATALSEFATEGKNTFAEQGKRGYGAGQRVI